MTANLSVKMSCSWHFGTPHEPLSRALLAQVASPKVFMGNALRRSALAPTLLNRSQHGRPPGYPAPTPEDTCDGHESIYRKSPGGPGCGAAAGLSAGPPAAR